MLTLAIGSCCDVCSDEYSAQCLPHSIPCGHVLCASCCTNICEKTPPRHSPACPFCRVNFTQDDVRVIRTDFTTSGWTTPRRMPVSIETSLGDTASELWSKRTEGILSSAEWNSRAIGQARRLEDKVARVAQKKCSVEEVSALHKELETYLAGVKPGEQISSLFLSAALLRAILSNHVAHAEASKTYKSNEAHLKSQVDSLEMTRGKLEAELRKQSNELSQKTHECHSLRTELSRLKAVASTLGASFPPSPPSSTTTTLPSPPHQPVSPPTSPLSRYPTGHIRSASMQSASRPTTPARSQTPAARPYTPSVSTTSASSQRSYTPAPTSIPRPSTTAPSIPRPSTTAPTHHRTPSRVQTPAPVNPQRHPRRLSTPSQPSPPKMARSLSEEKHENFERWIPPMPAPPKTPDLPKLSKYGNLLRAASMRSPQ